MCIFRINRFAVKSRDRRSGKKTEPMRDMREMFVHSREILRSIIESAPGIEEQHAPFIVSHSTPWPSDKNSFANETTDFAARRCVKITSTRKNDFFYVIVISKIKELEQKRYEQKRRTR